MEAHPDSTLSAKLVERGVLKAGVQWTRISPKDTVHKWLYKRACGRHYAYRTKGAVTKNPATLVCPLCHPRGLGVIKKCGRAKTVSQDELRLWRLLQLKFDAAGVVWSMQDRIKGWKGSIDVCLYFPLKRWLCIQVDGVTHWGKGCMSDRPEASQQRTDAAFDEVALRMGRSVLRLDLRHGGPRWAHALGRAVVACMKDDPPSVLKS